MAKLWGVSKEKNFPSQPEAAVNSARRTLGAPRGLTGPKAPEGPGPVLYPSLSARVGPVVRGAALSACVLKDALGPLLALTMLEAKAWLRGPVITGLPLFPLGFRLCLGPGNGSDQIAHTLIECSNDRSELVFSL